MSQEQPNSSLLTPSSRQPQQVGLSFIHETFRSEPELKIPHKPGKQVEIVIFPRQSNPRHDQNDESHETLKSTFESPNENVSSPAPSPPMAYTSYASSTASKRPDALRPDSAPSATNPSDRYNDLLDRIDDQRWTLRDQREILHGGRVRIHNQRQELRGTREKTLAQIDNAFTLLKQYLPDRDIELPQEIRYAFEDASTWCSRLEKQETDFQKAEEAYDLEEWIYTEQETKFVDDMCASEPFAPAPTRPSALILQSEGLTQYASGASEMRVFPADAEAASSYSPSVTDELVNVSALKQSGEGSTPKLDSTLERTATSRSLSALPTKRTPPLMSRPYSENDLSHVRLEWSDTRARIEEWLLVALEQSVIEKDLLRRIAGIDALDFDNWWILVHRYWKSDSPDDHIFHTGDTTKPPSTTGRRTSIIDVTEVQVNITEDAHEPETSLASPLVLQDRVVHAFDDFDFPTDIKPIDLIEPFPATSYEDEPSQDAVPSQMLSSLRLPEPLIHPKDALATRATESVDTYISSGEQSLATVHDNTRPSSRIALPLSISTYTISSRDSADRPQSNLMSPISPSTSFGTRDSPTQVSYDHPSSTSTLGRSVPHPALPLYIQVRSSDTWYLPLLRLTPSEELQVSSSRHIRQTADSSSQALPFVSNTNPVHRLPGPDPLC